MDFGIEGKVAVVCGATDGMGLGIAIDLAREQARVALLGRNEEALGRRVAEIRAAGGQAEGFPCDMRDRASVLSALTQIRRGLGDPDILVSSNFGHFIARDDVHVPRGLEHTSDEEFRQASDQLILDMVWLLREVLPGMKAKRWGRVIHLGSVAMKEPHRDPIYLGNMRVVGSAIIKTVANEYGPHGITANAIAPGPVDTQTFHSYIKELPGEMADADVWASQFVPAGRLGRKEDIAAMVTFLASNRAGWITGQTICVDGGMTQGLF